MRRFGKSVLILSFFWLMTAAGCASTPKPVEKLAKRVDQTAEEITKVRELKSDGETRAVVSPADERQVRISF